MLENLMSQRERINELAVKINAVNDQLVRLIAEYSDEDALEIIGCLWQDSDVDALIDTLQSCRDTDHMSTMTLGIQYFLEKLVENDQPIPVILMSPLDGFPGDDHPCECPECLKEDSPDVSDPATKLPPGYQMVDGIPVEWGE